MRKLAAIICAVSASGVMLGMGIGAGTSHAAPDEPEAGGMAWAIERKLDRWKPTKENDWAPSSDFRSPQTDIVGTWEARGLWEGTSLTIARSGPGSYGVTLRTHGCLGRWTLRRTGQYSDGVLVLNRPVREYMPITYQKVYACRDGSAEYLVPNVNFLNAPSGLTFLAFHRVRNGGTAGAVAPGVPGKTAR